MNKLTWYWISYIIIMLLVPFGSYGLKLLNKNTITPNIEKQKNFRKDIVFATISCWLYISFIFSLIIKNITISYISGVIIFLLSTISIIKTIINRKKDNLILDTFTILDFLSSIVIMIILLCKLPTDIQTIATPIIASIYGGTITLVGVGLSIKNSQKENNDKLVLQNKPLIFIINKTHTENQTIVDADLEDMNLIGDNFKSKKSYNINQFFIKNVDYSYSSIIGIKINDDVVSYQISQCLQKNTIYSINNISFNYESNIKSISLILKDMIENIYIYDLKFIIDKNNNITIECGLGSITML